MEGPSGTTDSLEQKCVALRRAVLALQEEKASLLATVEKSKQRTTRLQKERSFLLDRLLRYEAASDDESPSSASEQDDEHAPSHYRTLSTVQSPNHYTNTALSSTTSKGTDAFNSRFADPLKKKRPPGAAGAFGPGGAGGAGGDKPKPKRSRTSAAADKAGLSTDSNQMCIAQGKDKSRTCKSKALAGLQYCWHHAPLDPNSGFIFCQYVDPTKKAQKKCNIPVPKSKAVPFCNYHEKLIIPRRQRQMGLIGSGTDEAQGDVAATEEYDVIDPAEADEDEDDGEDEETNVVDEDSGLSGGEEIVPPRMM
eukprot:TRINITY_DN2237_c0_g1_i6.p2 TRINITY_DN2237_c0_g1~~TRINITY_DN2237_c0_g1_i6.p2  ORF type:complete len:309 (+),score=84.67 TRINITY_DN2237_c0_g1_i6:63-989(+)